MTESFGELQRSIAAADAASARARQVSKSKAEREKAAKLAEIAGRYASVDRIAMYITDILLERNAPITCQGIIEETSYSRILKRHKKVLTPAFRGWLLGYTYTDSTGAFGADTRIMSSLRVLDKEGHVLVGGGGYPEGGGWGENISLDLGRLDRGPLLFNAKEHKYPPEILDLNPPTELPSYWHLETIGQVSRDLARLATAQAIDLSQF